ncbi:hypothetical protein M5D96_011398 [Drosophila gunungcola]|uniref:Peptidase S1 domain-containing protein n=1 Tax=Drosophila gunungcola TaxID=103775 RepID=A0A9P9YFF3_9MUSC|nr:hypothetical protein M5D96_011398 [Drosophila gunungcola]
MVTTDGVQTLSAFGWGKTHEEAESRILNTLELQRRSDDKCHYIKKNQFCAGSNNGGDSCKGDSGGPVAASYSYRGKDRYVQFGVVSNGVKSCNDSAVYTDVNAYKYWIANTVLETETRLLTEHCGSDWGSGILVRLWEISLFEHNFTGALITSLLVKPICMGLNIAAPMTWTAMLYSSNDKRLGNDKCYSNNVNQICAGSNNGGDTCKGDSGGPLAASFPYMGKDRYVQLGVVSYGEINCKSNGVYTDVNAYKYWIANTVLEAETRLLTEHCGSDWGSGILVRLWEISLFEHNFTGALITSRFVVTVASAFPKDIHKIKVETRYLDSYDVDWFHKHPQFTYSAGKIQNNIAVIKLAKAVPDSVLVKPICMGLNIAAPMTWTAMLYSFNNQFMGTQSVALKRIDNAACSRKIGIPVKPNQLCVDKPNEAIYAPYDTPGSVIATSGTINGVEKYLLAGLISHVKDGVIVITNIQDHEKWIANELKY